MWPSNCAPLKLACSHARSVLPAFAHTPLRKAVAEAAGPLCRAVSAVCKREMRAARVLNLIENVEKEGVACDLCLCRVPTHRAGMSSRVMGERSAKARWWAQQ
eukprot:scaffold89984_cov66-Phaeocystis_antarctica.AAC.1